MKELNDLEYVSLSKKLLVRVEKIADLRSERLRLYFEKIRGIRAITACIIVSILPIAIWSYLLISEFSLFDWKVAPNIETRIVSLIILTVLLFLLPYHILLFIWRRPIFLSFSKVFEKRARTSLYEDIDQIDLMARNILSHSAFQNARVPDKYLTYGHLVKLEEHLKNTPAISLEEAVELLKVDLNGKVHYLNSELNQTLLQKELEYLSDSKQKFKKLIENVDITYC